MSQQLLVVVGATGHQGGSVANFVLSDPILSARYKVRGITRDPTQPAAEALRAKGAEVVKGDLNDAASIQAALAGVDTLVLVTLSTYDDPERELRQSKAAADAAVAAGAKYIIFSTEVNSVALSNGKYSTSSFNIKAAAEAYIRSLPVKSAFFAPGGFMQNFTTSLAPRPAGDSQPGVYVIANIIPGDRPVPLIDIVTDSGKFVGAILSEPDRFAGKFLAASSCLHSHDEVAAKISAHTGKTVQYVVLPEDTYRGFLPKDMQDPIVNMYRFINEFGYYGPGQEERIRETIVEIPYKLTSLDEYITANIKL